MSRLVLALCLSVLCCQLANSQTPIYGFSCCCGYSGSVWQTLPVSNNPCTSQLTKALSVGKSITCQTTDSTGNMVYATTTNGTLNITSDTPSSCGSNYNISCSNGVIVNGDWQYNFDKAVRSNDAQGQASATEEFACKMLGQG